MPITPERGPAAARQHFRAGLAVPTSGWAPGFVQANLLTVPASHADDVRWFAELNPQACPVLEVTPAGAYRSTLAPDADLRTDAPAYHVWRDGSVCGRTTDVSRLWRPDLVTFLIGCSFTAEPALVAAGIPLRHRQRGHNVAMYRTTVPCKPAGRVQGSLIVSMRPIPTTMVDLAVEITGSYPLAHGAPVHVGDPRALGIDNLAEPDFGDSVEVLPGEHPVFWACGLTPQYATMAGKPPLAITHAPGHMFITDRRITRERLPARTNLRESD
jgi:uncharacterized protein YcsI (UPF0317 family)